MAVKDSDKNQWKDPKDFGLPWVELKPIKGIEPISEPEEKEVEESTSAPMADSEEIFQTEIVPEIEVSKKKSEVKEKPSQKPVSKPEKKEKKSFAWAWIVVVLAIAVVGIILWQMQNSTLDQSTSIQAETKPVIQSPEPEKIQDSVAQIAATEVLQDSENQVSSEKSSPGDLNISKLVESGTTIAQSVKGNLIRIESKAERPLYFIVVGSVPSEQDALKLAPGFQARVSEVFLILPYAESSNYRLAIGKFPSFRTAAEELEKIKSQYTEELWILKY